MMWLKLTKGITGFKICILSTQHKILSKLWLSPNCQIYGIPVTYSSLISQEGRMAEIISCQGASNEYL